jgi:integrase
MGKKVVVGKYSLEELPSGSLRLRKMYNGETFTLIFESKPQEKEIIKLLSLEMEKIQVKKERMTFKTAAESYIDAKRNVLSPTTIREYTNTVSRLSENFSQKRISSINAVDVQREINTLAQTLAPKTIRNYHGFISAVLGMFCPNLTLRTTLPQKVKNEPYIPSDADIKLILKEVEGTPFEIPILLACFGLRRSEICALTLDDLNGDVLTIDKALVMNDDKEWVLKTTKTTESTRDIVIPVSLADKIREQGYVYKGHPNSISKHLTNLQDKLGMPHFSLHKLRHYFASKMSALGIPEADILKMGGWETDHVMKTVYRHSMQTERDKREAAKKLNNALFP